MTLNYHSQLSLLFSEQYTSMTLSLNPSEEPVYSPQVSSVIIFIV